MAEKQKYYITTPIYYPSGNPHVGHCYTTLACDVVSRFKRMQGYDVMFLTGTDEHGQKIEKKAQEAGVTPQAYVDEIVANFKKLWKRLDITYDRYIRTTDPYHVESVQKIFIETVQIAEQIHILILQDHVCQKDRSIGDIVPSEIQQICDRFQIVYDMNHVPQAMGDQFHFPQP